MRSEIRARGPCNVEKAEMRRMPFHAYLVPISQQKSGGNPGERPEAQPRFWISGSAPAVNLVTFESSISFQYAPTQPISGGSAGNRSCT
jgi:hypothetical protein